MIPTQAEFRRALLDAGQPVPAGLQDGAGAPAGRRFDVYRNNVAVSLTEAMQQAFPVATRLLGVENMDGLAGMFLRAHPPSSPLMMHYGDAFPGYLASLEQLAHLGYLPDVARLELALRRSYHAADRDALSPDTLAVLTPEQLVGARFELAPATQVLRSNWPVHDIWIYNMRDNTPKPNAGAQDVLITRPEFDTELHLLPEGGADWIEALMDGQTLGAATALAQQGTPAFDAGPTLAILLQDSAISSLTIPEDSE